jgi:hypothetical protein
MCVDKEAFIRPVSAVGKLPRMGERKWLCSLE